MPALVLAHARNISKLLACLELRGTMRVAKMYFTSLAVITYGWKTHSPNTGQKNMLHTPAFQQVVTLMVFQACMTFLCALSPFINGSKTVRQYSIELLVTTRLSDYALTYR